MSEHEDLTNLVKSPGWLLVKQFAEKEWEANLSNHVSQAANDRDDVTALNKLRQVIAAKNAVQRLLVWPEERLQRITASTEQAHAVPLLSRRGGL